MEIWIFLAKNSPKNQLHNTVLEPWQAQKCLQYDPKGKIYCYKIKKKIIQGNFLLTNLKRNLITAKAMGLILSLFDVALSRDMPFGILLYVQCMLHGLTFVLLCVPFLFADSPRCRFAVVQCVASLPYICKQESLYFPCQLD